MRTPSHIGAALTLCVLGAGVSSSGCGIPKDQYNKDIAALKGELAQSTDARTKLQGEYNDLKAQYEQCVASRDTCDRELQAMKAKGDKLNEGLQRALDRIAELERVAAKQRAVFERLRSSLDALVQAGKLKIAIVRGQFTVQLGEAILFDPASSALKRSGVETIFEVTQILAQLKGRHWQVAGHTDSRGGDMYNWRLSRERAWSVAKRMLEAGMPPERLSFAAYGEHAPTATNDTDEGRAQNRRIEIVLIPNLESILKPLLADGGHV